MTDDFNLEEIAAQYEPGGPIVAANEWVEAVLRRHDLAAGWPLMSEGLRRKSVRAWVDANFSHPALAAEGDPDELCEALIVDDPTGHSLWGGYAITQIREFREAWSHVNLDHCGFASRPRPIGPDLERVLLIDKGAPAPAVIDESMALPGIGFVMHHGPDGWLIEDFGLGDSEVIVGDEE